LNHTPIHQVNNLLAELIDGKVWTLNNAWPTKVTGTDLKSEGNEVAVESVEIAYETLVISAP
jgi:phage tail-like protein